MRARARAIRAVHVAWLAGASWLAVPPAWSAERAYDLIPTLGFRGGVELSADQSGVPPAEADPALSYGLTFNAGLTPETWLEAFLERQTLHFAAEPAFGPTSFDVHVDYLQIGAAYGPAREGVRGFVAASFGISHFDSSEGSVDSSLGFAGSLAGGFDAPLSPRTALRFEARGYATLADASFAVACGAGCVARFNTGGWYQLGARIGLKIRL